MIHHGCRHADPKHPLLKHVQKHKFPKKKATVAVMGYDGRYRCGECKRRVRMDVSDEAYERDLQMLPKAEPPYPDGWCE